MLRMLFIIFSIYLFSCSFSFVDDVESECQGTLRTHPQMLELQIQLICFYGESCDSYLYFGALVHSDSSHSCYADYEYKYTSKVTTKKIHKNDNFNNILDSDEHVRFSLFDKNNVEKSYDIDLSEIIHSYTFKGDSVEIKMPINGDTEISIHCPYCKERDDSSLCRHSTACHYQSSELSSVIIGTDSAWGNLYSYDLYLNKQSSLKTDSLKVFGSIEFRKN